MTWTDARIETLTNLWGDGLSASLIAASLGGTTRNAVIGKVRRLGLRGRATLVFRRSLPRPRPAPRTAESRSKPRLLRGRVSCKTPRPRRPAMPLELGPAPAIPVTVLTLTPVTCNWPEGDPKLAGFHFCGRKKPPQTAYCPHHAAIAYQPTR